MVLVFHVISSDHVIKESCDFRGGNLSRKVIIVPSLVARGTMKVNIKWFLFVS